MLKVLLATGYEKLDNSLLSKFKSDKNINLLNKPVYYREALNDTIEVMNADVVIISDFLEGSSLSQVQLIQLIRKKNPIVRIVYIIKDEENIDLKKFLFSLGVWDVISLLPKLDTKILYHLITTGNKWEDVSEFYSDFDPSSTFKLNEEFIFSKKTKPEYNSFGPKLKRNPEELLSNFNAFWSPRAQSGSTTFVSNTAVLLAQREEERVLVIDFNLTNPNLHLSLDVEDYDGDHNLSALSEDIAEGTFNNVGELKNYLLFHNTYKNISVLPGLILKYETPTDDILLKAIDVIFNFAKKESYTSIIFDMDNDLNMNCNVEILKSVSKIIMPLTERPGTIINLQKFFDPIHGPFFLNFLNINNVYPVMNKTTDTENTIKLIQIAENVLNRNIYAEIPYLKEIAISNNEGVPFLKEKPEPKIFREFIKLTNCVHDVFAVPPIMNNKRNSLNFLKKKDRS